MQRAFSVQEFQSIPKDKRKFVYLETRALDEVVVRENNEPIVKIKQYSKSGRKIFFEPNNDYAARVTVADMIYKAADLLPEGVHFMLYSGFRPIEIQQKLFDEIYNKYKLENPDMSEDELWDYTTRMIADPKGCPPHTTGGAIDLTLCNEEGVEFDMGSKVDDADNMEKCATFCDGLTNEQKEMRNILYSVMEEIGFVNLPTEWWHYSYGDRYWAAYNDRTSSLYSAQSAKECPGNYTR